MCLIPALLCSADASDVELPESLSHHSRKPVRCESSTAVSDTKVLNASVHDETV